MSEVATTSAASFTDPAASQHHHHDHHADAAAEVGIETMVKITAGAAVKVNEIRQTEGIESQMALRLRVVGGGCAGFSYDLYFDEATEVDRRFDVAGVDVVVDEMSLMYLAGTEVDYVEGLQGAGFKFNNPNVKSTCGCGSSFSV